ncbi:hypothetical protein MTO96_032762 [Rhipicephalus appendiculatus]
MSSSHVVMDGEGGAWRGKPVVTSRELFDVTNTRLLRGTRGVRQRDFADGIPPLALGYKHGRVRQAERRTRALKMNVRAVGCYRRRIVSGLKARKCTESDTGNR